VPRRTEFAIAVVGLGGIGSGALYWAAKRVGADAVGLERFELGHERGASQDHSRIIRLSYHRPEYVRFALDAYAAWSAVEESRANASSSTGGLDLYPSARTPRSATTCIRSSRSVASNSNSRRRTGDATVAQWRLADDVRVMYQADAGVAAAARANGRTVASPRRWAPRSSTTRR
jgi:sarcosine oxidase